MYFKEKHSVTSILYMYVFDLLTTNYPNKNILHNFYCNKYNCKKEKKQSTTMGKGFSNITQRKHQI